MTDSTIDAALTRIPDPAPDVAAAPALRPLKFGEMALFSTGDAVAGIKDYAIGTFLLLYLTAVCGLPGSLAGLALFVSLVIDAFFDPFIGYLSDSARTRLGRRHPFMLVAMVPLAIAFTMLFAVPRMGSDLGLFLYAAGMLVCVRIAHSTFTLPFIALGAEISRDYKERSLLGAFRSFFNICGYVVGVVLAFSVFLRGPNRLSHDAYIGFGLTCALVALAAGLICTFGTLGLRNRMHVVASHDRPSLGRFFLEVRDVVRNRSFRILFLTILIFFVAQGVAGGLGLHITTYFWRLPDAVIQTAQMAVAFGLATGIFVAGFVLQKFEKQQVSVAALGLFTLLQALPISLRLMGLLPLEGEGLHTLIYIVSVLTGWAVTCVGIAFGAMMADTADEHEWIYGTRREGLYFAGLTFSAKAAVGLGIFAGGVALDLTGFTREFTPQVAGGGITPDVLRNLGIAAGPISGLVAAISVVILTGYRLDAKKHGEIRREIEARRGIGG